MISTPFIRSGFNRSHLYFGTASNTTRFVSGTPRTEDLDINLDSIRAYDSISTVAGHINLRDVTSNDRIFSKTGNIRIYGGTIQGVSSGTGTIHLSGGVEVKSSVLGDSIYCDNTKIHGPVFTNSQDHRSFVSLKNTKIDQSVTSKSAEIECLEGTNIKGLVSSEMGKINIAQAQVGAVYAKSGKLSIWHSKIKGSVHFPAIEGGLLMQATTVLRDLVEELPSTNKQPKPDTTFNLTYSHIHGNVILNSPRYHLTGSGYSRVDGTLSVPTSYLAIDRGYTINNVILRKSDTDPRRGARKIPGTEQAKQVIELWDGGIINGTVTFESGNGVLVLSRDAKFNGKVIGGTVIHHPYKTR